MMSLRRRIMMNNLHGNGLPNGYTRVKYLQCNGMQYIDTGYVFDDINNTDFGIEIECDDFSKAGSTTGRVFGGSTGVDCYIGARFATVGSDTLTVDKRIGWSCTDGITIKDCKQAYISVVDNDVHKDGIYIGRYNHPEGFTSSSVRSCYLFAYNTSFLQVCKLPLKIKSFWINSLNERIIYFIPAIDQIGRPCMYDTVTKQPFYNQGTGEFGYELLDGTYVEPI